MKLLSYTVIISVLFSSIGQVAADLYLPSLPAITVGLHTTAQLVQMTVFFYMVGFSLSRIIYGPISDAVGRRKLLITGLLLCLLGTIICMGANSITILMIGRLLQGFGAGAGAMLAGAIVRDLLDGDQLAKSYSYMGLANVVLIASAPLIGGYLQHFFMWRANFIFITLYVLTALYVSVFNLVETNQYKTFDNLRLSKIKVNLLILFVSRDFMGYSIIIFLIYGALLSWLTLGPILLQNTIGISPVDFGWLAVISGSFYAIGSFLNARMIERYGINKILEIGAYIVLTAGIISLFFYLLGMIDLVVVIIPIVMVFFGAGFIFPNAFAGSLLPFPEITGTAGAILGFTQVMGGVVASGFIAILPKNTQLPLAITFMTAGLLILAMIRFVICTRKVCKRKY